MGRASIGKGRPGCEAHSCAPAVLLVGMSAAGRIIGRQGRTVQDLQQKTGAHVALLNGGSSLPGMRCGDRLLEVGGNDVDSRAEGFCAVWELASQVEGENAPSLLVPAEAIGYVIGRGGQTVRDVMARFSVDVFVKHDEPHIAG